MMARIMADILIRRIGADEKNPPGLCGMGDQNLEMEDYRRTHVVIGGIVTLEPLTEHGEPEAASMSVLPLMLLFVKVTD